MAFKFKPIVKGRVPTMRDFTSAFQAATSETARYGVKRFEETVATWDHKPVFRFRKVRDTGGRTVWEVFCEDEVYFYVNNGTPPHPIFPRNYAGVLVFPAGYGAKSRPGFMGSFPGGPSGPTVFARHVEHPGVEPRKFDVAVAAHVQRRYGEAAAANLRKKAKEFS